MPIRCLVAVLAGSMAVAGVSVLPVAAQADTPPDQVIAYVDSDPASTHGGIYLRDLQTSAVTHLLAGVIATTAAISPDGARVAYSALGTKDGGYASYRQLWTVPADGSAAPTEVTSLLCNVQAAAWSRDGSKIAFGCRGTFGSQVYVIDATSGAQLGSALGPTAMNPSFSPDGSQLVVEGDGGQIDVVNLTGQPSPWTNIANGTRPLWSPDGQRILYSVPGSGGRNRLWTVNPDGTSPTPVAGATPDTDDSVESWAWSGESHTIVFAGRHIDANDSSGPADLYFVDRNGARRWLVTHTEPTDEASVSVSGSLHATAPSAPTGVTVETIAASSSSVEVSWTAPDSDGGAPVTGYTVEAEDTPAGPFFANRSTSRTSLDFTGLELGRMYYFTVAAANAMGTGGWSSAAGPVTPRAATVTAITSITTSYVYGHGWSHVGGTVTRVSGGRADGAVVDLQARPAGSTQSFRNVVPDVADASGHVMFDGFRPARSIEYRLVTRTQGAYSGSTSGRRGTTVHPAVTIGLGHGRTVAGTAISVTGRVGPNLSGRTVVLQRWSHRAWRFVTAHRIRTGSTYAFRVRETQAARYRYRTAVPASRGLGSGTSASAVLLVVNHA